MENKNILVAGVGGQGTLLASKVLGFAALKLGYDVKMSEVHGMSQRGGSVVTYVKYGEKVYSPIICRGEADIIIAFEQLEALRWVSYLKKSGILITSTQKIKPMPVITGSMDYPSDIVKKIADKGIKIIDIDALELAKQAGSDKTSNVVVIGALAKYMQRDNISRETFIDALKEAISPSLIDVNMKAFDLGYAVDINA